MPSLISHLSLVQQKKLSDDLNYLNIEEYQSFCKKHSIPFTIVAETPDGKLKRTTDKDRKGVVLKRIRHYLKTGKILKETRYSSSAVNLTDKLNDPKISDRLHYGQYNKKNKRILALLKELTKGEFKDGLIARLLARDFWSKGHAPTFKEFADAWVQAKEEYTGTPNPEWAYLSDRAKGKNYTDWKKRRVDIAKSVMQTLNKLNGR